MAAITKVPMADVALCHVDDRDIELLTEWAGYNHGRQEAAPIVVYVLASGCGFIVSLSGVEEPDRPDELREAGFSDGFIALLRRCQQDGCWYVLLDQESTVVDDLPRYDQVSEGPPYDAATATGMYDS